MSNAALNVSDDLIAYKSVLVRYFRAVDLLPVFVPASQQIGDAYDAANKWAFLSSGSDCFPDLAKVEETASSLPDTIDIKQTQLSSAFGLPKFLSFGASASSSATVRLKFVDAKVRRVSQFALRQSLCPACEHLKPIVSGQTAGYQEGQPLPIIVGTVLSAKREVFVGDIEGAQAEVIAKAALGAGALPLEIVNLNPTMSAGLGYGSTSGCLLRSERRLPVAIAPAFFPQLIFDRLQSGSEAPDDVVAVEWHASDEAGISSWLDEAGPTLPMPDLG
jgi:hypothetical protein